MKIGLLARADTSGLGVQTYEFWRHMQPAKTLVIAAHWNSLLPVNPTMYPGAEIHPRIGMGLPARPDPVLDAFLDGLDLVFTAETPYNYWLWTRARERGVKTVQQFNYEFLFPNPAIPQPTLYAAPSLWHFDDVPFANRCYLPVPVARDRLPFRQRTELRTLLHTVGIPTDEDRNGTRIAMEAMQHVPRDLPVRLRVRTQDRGKLPPPMDDRVEMVVERIPNYWDVYQDEDAFVMPRKFGGLSLGVNEAASLGMPILMPAIDPQIRFLPGRTLVPPRTPPRKIQVMNPIHLYETYPHELAARIAELARRPEEVAALSRASDRYAESISWDRLKPLYVSTFERVCDGERLGVAA